MQVINIPTMKAMIHHIGVVEREPLCFHGPSGVGKSEGIEQSALEHDGILVDIRLSQYESVDLRGIPDIQSGSTVWNAPATIPFKGNRRFEMADPSKPIFLFLDEIDAAEPSTAAVAYQLVNDRRVGEHELLDNTIIVAARNRAQDKGVSNRVPAPLNNRFTHAELVADVKPWSAWAATAGISDVVIGFLNFRDSLFHTFDPAKPTPAFATPRSWVKAARYFASTTMPADVKGPAISGAVGEGPAVELQAFADIMSSLVPIEQIIADPKGVQVGSEMDIQWALATHVAGHMTKDTATPLQTFLDRLAPEMVVMAWTLAINKDADLTDTDAFLNGYAPRYHGLFR